MKELTWVEYNLESRKNKELLESLVKRVLKVPNKSIDYSCIKFVEKNLNFNGYYNFNNEVTLKEYKEEIIINYKCDDEVEKKEMIELVKNDIIKIDNFNIYYKSELKKPHLEFKNILADVLTSNEAAEIYNISEGTLRSAMKTGRLKLGIDYRKAGRITLIKKTSMERLYGEIEK